MNNVLPRMISDNKTKEIIRSAIRILNGFTQGVASGDSEDLMITDKFLNMYNLTVFEIMMEIGLVIIKNRREFNIK